jgi:hypothetical protein
VRLSSPFDSCNEFRGVMFENKAQNTVLYKTAPLSFNCIHFLVF